jgi:glycosyltransferase involved in cell wall biosynthesis
MRIAIIANSYDPSFGALAGGHVHFLQVARRWTSEQITIFAPEPMRLPYMEALPQADFVATPSFHHVVRNVRLDALLKAICSFASVRRLREHDVILCTSHFLADVVPAILARRGRSAVIVWHLQAPAKRGEEHYWIRQAAYASERIALWLVRAFVPTIIVGSRWMARRLGFDRAGKLIFVTTNGVDHRHHSSGAGACEARSGALYLGRVHRAKGIEDLLRAWSMLRPSCAGEQLTIAGDCASDYLRFLRHTMDELGIRNRVQFTGRVTENDKWRLLERAKVFVLASREEGWGIALAEAMACAVPCVTYDLPVFREVFPRGRRCAAVGDAGGLADEISALLANEDQWLAVSRQALELAATFSWQKAAEVELQALWQTSKS